MLFFYGIAFYNHANEFDLRSVITSIVGVAMYVVTMGLLNHIALKNDLTKKSTHAVLLFAFSTAFLQNALLNVEILVANALVLLGVINILTIRNEIAVKSKIMNASLCIALASVFYFWSFLFLILIYIGIFIYSSRDYRNWIIPIAGWLTIFILSNGFLLLIDDSFLSISEYLEKGSFNFKTYGSVKHAFILGTLIICASFFLFFYGIKFKRRSARIKPRLNIIVAQFIIAIALVLVAPNKNTSELYFVAAPLAIIGTSYFEHRYGKMIDEINVWVFLLFPIVIFFL